MRFAVIAAGEGSRLAQEGVEQPKPLVPVCGEPMIERLLRIFVDCGATEIVVIVNEWSTAVREHLEQMKLPVPLRLVVKTTPSSMHSLHALSPYLRGERFCLTTVDTIFREEEFKKYIRHFQEAKDIDGCMAVTPYVDDEKPLYFGISKLEFDRMLKALQEAYRQEHKRKTRFTKISMMDKLILTLIYRYEYRTMESIAKEYEVSLDTIADNIHWVERTLLNADILQTSVTCVYKTN